MKTALKYFFIALLVLIVGALVVGFAAYKNRDIDWDEEKRKTENLITALQKVIIGMEGPLPQIKNYLDMANSVNNTPGVNGAIDESQISVYEDHYQKSLELIANLEKIEEDGKDLLQIIEEEDKDRFRSLKKQVMEDVKMVEEWSREYQESADRVKALRGS